jgi:hypothetical protein
MPRVTFSGRHFSLAGSSGGRLAAFMPRALSSAARQVIPVLNHSHTAPESHISVRSRTPQKSTSVMHPVQRFMEGFDAKHHHWIMQVLP